MNVGKSLSLLLLPIITGTCAADDMRWTDFLKRHISNNLISNRNSERGKGSPGRSGYIGPVYRGKVTLHYDQERVPP